MATRIAMVALAAPLVMFGFFKLFPEYDHSWGTQSFHFWVVSAASLMSAAACLLLILSARSMRETRIMFLALSFFALAMFFSVHGLGTPGYLFDQPYAALQRSPWLATLAAGVFATLSVIGIPRLSEGMRLRSAQAVFGVSVVVVTGYFGMGMVSPDWLAGFPTQAEWFQNFLTVTTISLLCFAAFRYYQSYQFARLPGQLAVAVGLVFLAEAQISLDFGVFWAYSWWMYHGLFLVAFGTVLFGWGWEVVRAKDGNAIAEGLAMRDALSAMNRGRPADLVSLADQIENHDLETFRHVDRVAAFAYAIGRELGFNATRLRELVLGAQMHDVGKIGLPPYILQKAASLTDDEWAQIKLHPGKGYEIMQRVRNLAGISFIVRHHHEHFDGSGYPDGLSGDDIPLESRIVSVADTFDAMTSTRPYRPALSVEEARAELNRVSGAQLDPSLVAILIKLLDNGTLSVGKGAPSEEHTHGSYDSPHTHVPLKRAV